MDIWRWVDQAQEDLLKQGNVRLSDMLSEVASLVVDEEHEKVDAIMPEVLALAKKSPNKWIELFFRHWHLQSRVLSRCETKDALPEAISLLDFAHQEDTKDCPQSVCVVQDLASCYANQDGPGFSQERLDVASEALDKINPEWPCFSCIGSEYCNALIDMGKYEESLAFINDYKEKLEEFDRESGLSDLCFSEAEALISLNRLDEAKLLIIKAKSDGGGEHFENRKQGCLAYINALLKSSDEALNHLKPFEIIIRTPSLSMYWVKTLFELAKQNEVNNDWHLNEKILQITEKLSHQGCYRNAFELYSIQAELAIIRQQKHSAERALHGMKYLQKELARDCGAEAAIADLSARINDLKSNTTINFELGPDQLAHLDENPYERISQIKVGLQHWPGNESLILALSECYRVLNQKDNQLNTLMNFLDSHPNSSQVILEYGFEGGNYNSLAKLLDHTLTQECEIDLHWSLANLAQKNNQLISALEHVDVLLTFVPSAINALKKAQEIAFELKEYQRAISYNLHLIKLKPDETDFYWDNMLYATLTEDWVSVRSSASYLELPIKEGEGEISEDWGTVRIKLNQGDDSEDIVIAKRTGPVTAQILEAANIHSNCYVGHNIIFDPMSLNRRDQQDESGRMHDQEGYYTNLHQQVGTNKTANYRIVALDGFLPTEEQFNNIKDRLHQADILFDHRSSLSYKIEIDDKEYTGLYAFLYLHEGHTDLAIHHLLIDLCKDLPLPLIWPKLAAKVDDITTLENMAEAAEKYQIELD